MKRMIALAVLIIFALTFVAVPQPAFAQDSAVKTQHSYKWRVILTAVGVVGGLVGGTLIGLGQSDTEQAGTQGAIVGAAVGGVGLYFAGRHKDREADEAALGTASIRWPETNRVEPPAVRISPELASRLKSQRDSDFNRKMRGAQ